MNCTLAEKGTLLSDEKIQRKFRDKEKEGKKIMVDRKKRERRVLDIEVQTVQNRRKGAGWFKRVKSAKWQAWVA